MQCGQFIFVCKYIYIYLSHFNCLGAVYVVSYEPRSTGLTTRRSRRDRGRVEMEQARRSRRDRGRVEIEQARATWYWSD